MIEISQKIGYNQVRGDYMSIICAVYLPEGIVMAADSRITRTKYWKDEQGARHELVYPDNDNAQKVFMLGKTPVGIASCGDAFLDGKPIANFIRIFEIECIMEGDSPETVAKKLWEYTATYHKNVQFIVSGYELDEPYVFCLDTAFYRMNLNEKNELLFGASWKGQCEAITKLFNSEPKLRFTWVTMPLKDGVDLAEFIVDTTIKYQRFQDGIQTCGGAIDILVINKDRAFWYQHKLYK